MSLSGLSSYTYNTSGKEVPVNTHDLFKNTNNIFSEIIKDKQGELWIGAFSEGVFKIDFEKPMIENFPLNLLESTLAPSFTTLCEDSAGDIWLNQNRLGLYIYSPLHKKIRFYTEIDALKDRPELKHITHLGYVASLDEVWILNELNSKILKVKKTRHKVEKVQEVDLRSALKNPGRALLIFEDVFSNVWIGTDRALFVQANNSDKFKLVKDDIGIVTSITQDINHTIWIATQNNGIFQTPASQEFLVGQGLNPPIKRFENPQLGKHIQSITTDFYGNVWIGTTEGNLWVYSTLDKILTNKTAECGLKGETILDIISDKFNNIWITSYKKVIEFNPKNNASFSYTKADGMQINSHLKGSLFKSCHSNYMYIGGNRGYSRFTPSEHLTAPARQTTVKITDVKIKNKSIFFEGGKAEKFEKQNNTLRLSPSDKNIELYFSAINYSSPNKIRYAYKLEGVDDDWLVAKEGRQFVVYNQLKKGIYTFNIKSSDSHNLWNDNVTQLKIVKQPEFYETKVAFIFYTLFVALCIYLLIYTKVSRIKLRASVRIAQIEKYNTEELTQTKLKYFTNISHDLLTPLTTISCLVDDMETTVSKPSKQFALMRSNVIRLKRLLQQILDFRRMESGKMQLQVTNSDIASFIKDICYNHFLFIFNRKKITFTFSAQPNVIMAYFDAEKIDKVLFNLLSNAFKFTPESGEVSVNLSQKTEDEHTVIEIQITDNGIGIAPEDIEQIFTRFYTNRTLKSGDTNGVGLSLSKDLVELHHGSISVKSEINQGAVSTIKIPINKGSYSVNEFSDNPFIPLKKDTTEVVETENESTVVNVFSGDVKILLVDDNLELLELMQQILSRSFHVITATNGVEAIEMLRSNDIDIIVSDVMMPQMGGLELCSTLKGNLETSHISVILLTAKNSINDRIECYNAGADAYISKPFEMDLLQARIRNFMSNKQRKQKEFKSAPEINISSLENHFTDEQFLNHAVEIIERNITKPNFDIHLFAEDLNISKSSLYRKIKTITGLSPVEFIRNIKLKHASVMLKNNTVSITEVAYAVGFADPKYFSSCFKTEFGITPSKFRKQG